MIGADGYLGRTVAGALESVPGTVVTRGSRRPRPGAVLADLSAAGLPGLVELLRATRPDAVVNCAGVLTGSRSAMVEANVAAVAHLLDAMDQGAPSTRLVHLGSAAEYGRTPHGTRCGESRPPDPVATYGRTKLAGTLLVRDARAVGRDTVVLRISNVVGPDMAAGTVVGAAIRALQDGISHGAAAIQLGPLEAVRDYVDVRDVGRAVAMAALADDVPPPVVNIGSGVGVQVRELVEHLASAAGFRGIIEETALSSSPRSVAVPWQVADIRLARTTLGWSPAHGLADAAGHAWTESLAG